MASPEIVTAMAIAGDMTFNPLTDSLINEAGEEVQLQPPVGDELPKEGFDVSDMGYQESTSSTMDIQIIVLLNN